MDFNIKYSRILLKSDEFTLSERLGEGSSGIIYEISDEYVIKILKEGHQFEYDFYNLYMRTLNESYISNLIGLPISYGNIDNNQLFIILNKYSKFNIKYTKGTTLEIKLIRLIYQLLVVEDYLETELQFVNLDFKLNNLMLDINNDIKVIDFGLIKKFNKDDIFYSYKNYYIWPLEQSPIRSVPLYSIFILIASLFLEYDIINNNTTLFILNRLKENFSESFQYIMKLLADLKYNSKYIIYKINTLYAFF